MISTGEHEATRWGFRQLLETGVDIIQPDVGWCGGITELIKISALADAHGALVIPHGSSVYSYHFVVTRTNSPFSEFIMMHPTAEEVVPMFSPMLLGEPVPVNGRLVVPETPGSALNSIRPSRSTGPTPTERGSPGPAIDNELTFDTTTQFPSEPLLG